jgi:hypothetical protein
VQQWVLLHVACPAGLLGSASSSMVLVKLGKPGHAHPTCLCVPMLHPVGGCPPHVHMQPCVHGAVLHSSAQVVLDIV